MAVGEGRVGTAAADEPGLDWVKDELGRAGCGIQLYNPELTNYR
jgi:hypothetical protein